MTISYRQDATTSEDSAVDGVVTLANAPLNGSTLIAVVGCLSNNGAISITQTGATWNLLETSSVTADTVNSAEIRVQVWGAFNVENAGAVATFAFSGGTTNRGMIVVEYYGNVFEFPNPPDRMKTKTGSTAPTVLGTIDTTPATAITREDEELFIGVAGISEQLVFSNSQQGFSARKQIVIGAGANTGKLAIADQFTSSAKTVIWQVDHAAHPTNTVYWAAVVAGIRGALQVPFVGGAEPTVSEPVTEQTDYSSDGIGKLASQFRAKS
jgi:hypothetical protein